MPENFKKNRIDIITMGCSKNLIDSERLIKRLQAKGYEVIHDSDDPTGELVIVNTCGFIADAKEESIEMLLSLAKKKESGDIGKIYAMGCLTERYRNQLLEEMPEIDSLYGKFDWAKLIDELPDRNVRADKKVREWDRTLTTPPHCAYLKISEGCNRFCAFCAIPLITGRHTSRPEEEILDEVRTLVSEGVKEFNIIAQDLSSYGTDLYGSQRLASLLDSMAGIEGVEWIRLHYAYPADFPMDILPVIARHDNICKYLDIALQHISDKVLNNMRRHISGRDTVRLLEEIRKQVPGIRLRTTLMVGFPGEDEAAFNELLEFVKDQKFDRMGAFAYSEEDDTWAAKNLIDNVYEEVKQERLNKLLDLQEKISEDLNGKMIGETVRLIVDSIEDGVRVCRSQYSSPEVDPVVYVENTAALPGDMINAVITDALPFEFYAEEVKES